MPPEQTAEQPKTVHDIAAAIMGKPADDATQQSAKAPPTEGKKPVVDEEPVVQEEPVEEGDDEEDFVEAEDLYEADEDTETLNEEGVDEEADDQDDADRPDVLELSDDDLIEVKIDGQIEYRSLAEAKKALSGDGAYHKRVKEATELRKAAQAEHTQLLERFNDAGEQFAGVVSELEKGLVGAATPKPDASLRQSNPQAYMQQLEQHEADQERVIAAKDALNKMVGKQQEILNQKREEFKKEQAMKLAKAIPALSDAQKAPKMIEGMKATAAKYGFTEQEMAQQADHRYYLMVADLMKFTSARGKVSNSNVRDVSDQKKKRPRTLRSGATAAKSRAKASASRQQKATKTARQTGKVKDVAATLLRPKG